MLKRLHLQNFTVFADADFEFGPGLNVLVGTNGTGKSHVLKVGYASLETASRSSIQENNNFKFIWDEKLFQHFLFKNLTGVFQPKRGNLGQLICWQTPQAKSSIRVEFGDNPLLWVYFGFAKAEISEYTLHLIEFSEKVEAEGVDKPIFIPAKEVLTLAWISRLDERYKLPIDSTYLDLLALLRHPPLRHPENTTLESLTELENLIGGTVEQEGERFYLSPKQGALVEMDLVAEGIRKFGILFQLLTNGSLTKNSTLFWDEPESNLNPALLRQLAAILAELARQGFQIILATHSMSLLKEFHILSREPDKEKLPIKYFGLNARPGQATTVISRDNFEYLPDVVALDVELEQADKLEKIFAREDRESHADNR